MIGSAVALDAEHVAARSLGIGNGEIDDESGDADLTTDVVAQATQSIGDLRLEHAVMFAVARAGHVEPAGTGELEEDLEPGHTDAARPFEINVLVGDRGENLAAVLGPGNEHVETPFAALAAQRAEAHVDGLRFRAAIADRDHDHVALVALPDSAGAPMHRPAPLVAPPKPPGRPAS